MGNTTNFFPIIYSNQRYNQQKYTKKKKIYKLENI